MTKKIYLETFEKCPGSLHFPLLMSKIASDCHLAIYQTESYFKTSYLVQVFGGAYYFFNWFQEETYMTESFPLFRQKPSQILL